MKDSRELSDGFVASGVPLVLVEELMEGFAEAKRRFHLGDYRPNAVEGARFAEAAFRILQWATNPHGEFTAIGKSLPRVDKMLESFIASTAHDSVRKHIPRALQMIYTIRNERDVAHLGDGIQPNFQDASLVVNLMGWTLAELVRLYHSLSAEDAQRVVDELVTREVPIIQIVRGFPRVLRDLRAGEHCLVLLYSVGTMGASFEDLRSWVRPAMRGHLRRTLDALVADDLVHRDVDEYFVLKPGEKYVEEKKLVTPI